MSDLRTRITSHNVFAELENVRRSVDKVLEGNPPTDVREDIDRVKAIVEFARSVLDQSDPLYLAPQMLEDIRTQAKGVRGELNNYVGNKNSAHVKAANDRCDQVIPLLRGLPIPFKQMGVEEYVATFEDFRRTVYGYLEESSKKVGEVTAAADRTQQILSTLDRDISQQKPRVDALIAEFQTQFTKAQGDRQTEYAKEEKSRAEANTDLIRRIEEASKSTSDLQQSKFSELYATIEARSDELSTSLNAGATAEITQIRDLRMEAEKIVGLIGEHGMVHGYQTQANEAQGAFRFWSGIAVGSLLVWIGVGLIAFWLTYHDPLTWSLVGRQFLISTPFLLLATFAGYQAFVQQRGATRFRRRELEIASLDPFLASLTLAESNEIKKQMVSKFFGHGDGDDIPPPPDLAAIVTNLIDRLQPNGKKLRD